MTILHETVAAIVRLDHLPDWQGFVKQLETDLEIARDEAANGDNVLNVRRSQGKAIYLADLLESIRNARNTLQRMDR